MFGSERGVENTFGDKKKQKIPTAAAVVKYLNYLRWDVVALSRWEKAIADEQCHCSDNSGPHVFRVLQT